MDVPYHSKPTAEMKIAAAVWVLLALVVILIAHPKEKPKQANTKDRAPHFGTMFELK